MARGGLGLGSGLGSLFEQNAADPASGVQTVRITEIEQNRAQPRKVFDDEALTELAQSIQAHGMIQPIVVRPIGEKRYQIVAGERRWRAAKRIGLSEVPVIIREMNDTEAGQIALIENLQRENLNPIEEAMGYQALMEQFHMTQDEVAKTVGRSRPAVANSLRLLNLPVLVQEFLEKGRISVGHAKALAAVKDEQLLLQLAQRAAEDRITVREIEAISQRQNGSAKAVPAEKQKTPEQIFYEEMEISLGNHLGRRVQVQTGKKKGTLTLEFYNREDLQALCQLLTKEDENQ
ncbi:MAG: ParB/RepB/Spo0J family partition protein [Oscillospiraceae bacterium]|nr:ParB/RepB/Spo0J family partition protein [Oscillospiraceae bacterium]